MTEVGRQCDVGQVAGGPGKFKLLISCVLEEGGVWCDELFSGDNRRRLLTGEKFVQDIEKLSRRTIGVNATFTLAVASAALITPVRHGNEPQH